MQEEIKTLFDVLAPKPSKNMDTTYQLYGLDKWNLFMRLVIAFHNGYTGVRYDDAYEMDHIQERLDALFGSGVLACRRGFDGRAILFPHHLLDGRMGFVRYTNCFFSSDATMAEREGLMRSVRNHARGVTPMLVACALQCSSEETRLLKEVGLWWNLPARQVPGARAAGKR